MSDSRRVWGVTFAEPGCPYSDLVSRSLTESQSAMLTLVLGTIPLMGLGAVGAGLAITAVERDDNRYGDVEQMWKAAVLVGVLQFCYITLGVVFYV